MPDPIRFDALYRPHHRGLYQFALHLTRDPVRADDLIQQAVEVGLSKISQLSAEPAFRAWMSQIVYRTHLNQSKAAARSDARSEPLDNVVPLPSPDRDPLERLEQRELAQDVATALSELPDDQARAVWLVDGQGFKFREAAEILDVPRGTAATLVLRGRKRLAERLAEQVEVAR